MSSQPSNQALRFLFPTKLVVCRHCGHGGLTRGGPSRSGEMRWLRCGVCKKTFTIRAIAVEELTASGEIQIRSLRTYNPKG